MMIIGFGTLFAFNLLSSPPALLTLVEVDSDTLFIKGSSLCALRIYPVCFRLNLIKTTSYRINETSFQRVLKCAAKDAGINRTVNPYILRHSFASHLLADGFDIRQIQELLGHSDIRTIMIYTHTVKTSTRAIKSPLDV